MMLRGSSLLQERGVQVISMSFHMANGCNDTSMIKDRIPLMAHYV